MTINGDEERLGMWLFCFVWSILDIFSENIGLLCQIISYILCKIEQPASRITWLLKMSTDPGPSRAVSKNFKFSESSDTWHLFQYFSVPFVTISNVNL